MEDIISVITDLTSGLKKTILVDPQNAAGDKYADLSKTIR